MHRSSQAAVMVWRMSEKGWSCLKRKKENFWWNPGSEQDLYHDKNAGTWKQEIVKEDRMNVGIPTEKNKKYNKKNRRSDLNTKNAQERSD